jgi:hypothetical protein
MMLSNHEAISDEADPKTVEMHLLQRKLLTNFVVLVDFRAYSQ